MHGGGKRVKGVSYAKYGYIFSIPFILMFIIFSLYPTVFTAVIGFTDFKGVTARSFHFLKDPFANFASVLNNGHFKFAQKHHRHLDHQFHPQIGWRFCSRPGSSRRPAPSAVRAPQGDVLPAQLITAATVAILYASILATPWGPSTMC
jgi:multiple sugar transport system permease protein